MASIIPMLTKVGLKSKWYKDTADILENKKEKKNGLDTLKEIGMSKV